MTSPTDNLLERVARAIAEIVWGPNCWSDNSEDVEPFLKQARAAIAVINEASNDLVGEMAETEATAHAWKLQCEEMAEELGQIRDLNGKNYDSDRAWALAMQLRAKVALQGWL